MRINDGMMRRFAQFVVLLMAGVSMGANAGLFGFGSTSWKEEVLLHDGSKIVVERSFSRGGRHEIGQGPPVKEQDLSFTMPGSSQTITWKSEYSEDVGRSNFNLLALHILNGMPYVVTEPNLCLSYNKWGRPNPPYVIFKYDGKQWQRIPLAELPPEFKEINMVIVVDDADLFREIDKQAVISVATVKKLNSGLTQPEFKTILREMLPNVKGGCIKTDYYEKAGWLSPDWFTDQPSLGACLKFCDNKKISSGTCPCQSIFKGK